MSGTGCKLSHPRLLSADTDCRSCKSVLSCSFRLRRQGSRSRSRGHFYCHTDFEKSNDFSKTGIASAIPNMRDFLKNYLSPK